MASGVREAGPQAAWKVGLQVVSRGVCRCFRGILVVFMAYSYRSGRIGPVDWFKRKILMVNCSVFKCPVGEFLHFFCENIVFIAKMVGLKNGLRTAVAIF